MFDKNQFTGIVLAGGQGSRMGGVDKGLVLFKRRPLIEYSLVALKPNVANIIISANQNIMQYRQYARVVQDVLPDFQGPLAGLSVALNTATTDYIVLLPCDIPFINSTAIQLLMHHHLQADVDISIVNDGTQIQPMVAVINTSLADDLSVFLSNGSRKLRTWQQRHKMSVCKINQRELFVNINDGFDLQSDLTNN